MYERILLSFSTRSLALLHHVGKEWRASSMKVKPLQRLPSYLSSSRLRKERRDGIQSSLRPLMTSSHLPCLSICNWKFPVRLNNWRIKNSRMGVCVFAQGDNRVPSKAITPAPKPLGWELEVSLKE